jgi:hypothetical protein
MTERMASSVRSSHDFFPRNGGIVTLTPALRSDGASIRQREVGCGCLRVAATNCWHDWQQVANGRSSLTDDRRLLRSSLAGEHAC